MEVMPNRDPPDNSYRITVVKSTRRRNEVGSSLFFVCKELAVKLGRRRNEATFPGTT